MALQHKRKTRMYEPWGYREENNYLSEQGEINNKFEKIISKVVYDEATGALKFYNTDGDYLSGNTIDVSKFAAAHVTATTFDSDTKIYYIYYDNGDVVELDMSDLLDEAEAGDGLTATTDGKLAVKIDPDAEDYLSVGPSGVSVTSAITDAFTDVELNWQADANGFNIDFFNSKANKMDTVTLFETDANGNVHIGPGADGPGF